MPLVQQAVCWTGTLNNPTHMTTASKWVQLWNHPAGPKTIHFWAPAFKWGLVIAGLADINRPVENVSIPQSVALSCTGLIWSRYATQIIPVNYNLLSVNIFVGATGLYQLFRVWRTKSQTLALEEIKEDDDSSSQ